MTDIKVNAQETPKVRNKRKPFNASVSRLTLDKQLEGWHYRWVNDEPGRIAKALAGDYVFATPEEVGRNGDKDNLVSIHGGANPADGTPMQVYLMRIPLEFYNEDRQTHTEHLDSIDAAIRGGKPAHDIVGGYVPKGGISIKTK